MADVFATGDTITAAKLNQIRDKVASEAKKRSWSGETNVDGVKDAAGTLVRYYSVGGITAPTSANLGSWAANQNILAATLNQMSTFINAINSGSVVDFVANTSASTIDTNSKLTASHFNDFNTKIDSMVQDPAASTTGCAASCTGLCQGGCYSGCKGCWGESGSATNSTGQVSPDGCTSCQAACVKACKNCGSTCGTGCMGSCSTVCGSGCGGGCLLSCGGTCGSSCSGTCGASYCKSECQFACGGGCSGCSDTCEAVCTVNCRGGCSGCGGCSRTCYSSCSGNCGNSCSGCTTTCSGCSANCMIGCGNNCSSTCYRGCTTGCRNCCIATENSQKV